MALLLVIKLIFTSLTETVQARTHSSLKQEASPPKITHFGKMAQVFAYPKGSYDEYYRRSNQQDRFLSCVNEHKDMLDLSSARVCLSIGAGRGEVDVALIQNLMPALQCYHAVEPDPCNMAILHENIGKLAQMKDTFKTIFSKTTAQGYGGPGEDVDVILLLHMLYYVPDSVGFLRSCLSWLAPGGCVIITILQSPAIHVEIKKQLHMNRVPPDEVSRISHTIHKIGFKEVQVLPFTFNLDITNANTELTSFLLARDASKTEVEILQKIIKDSCGDNEVDTWNVDFYICKK